MRDATVPRFNPLAEPARTTGFGTGQSDSENGIRLRQSDLENGIRPRQSDSENRIPKTGERERDWVWDRRRRVQRSRRRSRAPTGEFTVAFGHGHPLVLYINSRSLCVTRRFRVLIRRRNRPGQSGGRTDR